MTTPPLTTEQTTKPNGWTEWSNYVLKTLETQAHCMEGLGSKIDALRSDLTRDMADMRVANEREFGSIRRDIGMLQARSGLWGAAAAAVVSTAAAVVMALLKVKIP